MKAQEEERKSDEVHENHKLRIFCRRSSKFLMVPEERVIANERIRGEMEKHKKKEENPMNYQSEIEVHENDKLRVADMATDR